MKLLQINAVYGYGSTGKIVQSIHELALSKGAQSYVAYSQTNLSKDSIVNGYKIGGMFGKKLHALLYRFGGKQAYFSRFSTLKLIGYIKKIKPDIVSLHNLHSCYINLNMLLRFLAKKDIKTVITMHDCWFYTGGCFHYSQIGCDKWQYGCGNCPKRKSDLKAYVTENSAKVLNDRKKYFSAIKDLTCIGVSDWITNEAKKSYLKDKKHITIKNGIDLSFFKPTSSNFRNKYGIEDKFVILGLASKFFNPVNDETRKHLIENLETDDVFVLIGCTPKQIECLPSNVIGLPYIGNREQMRDILSACDVFANCSREDTLSTVNIEAQACGTPVIVYDNTGCKETVNDNLTGYVVENGNFSIFVNTIKIVKDHEKKYYSDNCVNWAKYNFDSNHNYNLFFKLFSSD